MCVLNPRRQTVVNPESFWGWTILREFDRSCHVAVTTDASCSAAKAAIALVLGWSNIKVLGNLQVGESDLVGPPADI